MKCKSCHNQIPDGSIFCNLCGERQVKERKKKDEIKVPTPRQLKSGAWNIELKREGVSGTFDSAEEATAWAKAIRAGFVASQPKRRGVTLSEAIDKYIAARSEVLSPATVRGYRTIQNNRFASIMNEAISGQTDWQRIVNDESKQVAPKTLKNSWLFIATILRANGIVPPKVRLPQDAADELPWLDYKQILEFCDAVKGQPCELAALMALSSLRRSELCAVSQNDISADCKEITVHGAKVPNEKHQYIIKDTNKNKTSRRIVPVLIPRLEELLTSRDREGDYLINVRPDTLRNQINRVCAGADLPLVGVHGLRRSFVSLGYHLKLGELDIMQIGGWNDFQTVHKHYLRLAAMDKKRAEKKMAQFYNRSKLRTNLRTAPKT